MKKIILFSIMIIGLLFQGCQKKETYLSPKEEIQVSRGITIYCDKETNIEYIIFKCPDSLGVSVRYNENGEVKKCVQKKL